MEHNLRCNNLQCRKELCDRALVTTCSHCFCFDCAKHFQLFDRQDGQYPTCPACHMHLTNPDDAVLATLNPSEDYKTSVLSGLNPTIIMECAGRALSFWAYQSTQEMFTNDHCSFTVITNEVCRVYQEYCAKNLTNKYAALNTQMDKIIHDANAELLNMRSKLSNLQLEQDNLRRKNNELAQQLRDKTRKYHQTQELYDKMKRRNLLDHVQNAASDAVEQSIHDTAMANRYVETNNTHNLNVPPPPPPPPPPPFLNHNSSSVPYPGITNSEGMNKVTGKPWPGFSRQPAAQSNYIQTPSTHRTKFPPENFQPQIGLASLQETGIPGATTGNRFQMNPRGPLSNVGRNGHGFSGYGISSGLKTSASMTEAPIGFARPTPRMRVAQRKPSGLSTIENIQPSHNLSTLSNENF